MAEDMTGLESVETAGEAPEPAGEPTGGPDVVQEGDFQGAY